MEPWQRESCEAGLQSGELKMTLHAGCIFIVIDHIFAFECHARCTPVLHVNPSSRRQGSSTRTSELKLWNSQP